MKIVTIIGARPQFIKAAAISRVIRNKYSNILDEIIVHTGQHFDENMSKIFFDELDIPSPNYNLQISGGHHGEMTGRMLQAIEAVLLTEKPDLVLLYGDTNSTLAGALAGSKLTIPVAHVEAGLRSYNMHMPEEINRVLTDHVSTLLFCPTETAVKNLTKEGISANVFNVGDVMFDISLHYREIAKNRGQLLAALGVSENAYVLATCHRAENTDNRERLKSILEALNKISKALRVVFPLHPRTRKLVEEYGFGHLLENLKIIEPVSFLDMVALQLGSRMILTDSGGVQKEAYFYAKPCLTLRDETEWVETVSLGWNKLVGASTQAIVEAFEEFTTQAVFNVSVSPYGDGRAGEKVVEKILEQSWRVGS